jgi:UDP-N-acetylglucosamine acyltransferase
VANAIHPTAIVAESAELGDGNVIDPYVVVEDGVVIGNGNRIEAHSVIKRGARIGNANHLHPHVVFADTPQDLSFTEAESYAVLGDRNTLREFVTVHRATTKEEGRTVIGDDNYLMAGAHVAHDCHLGHDITIAPYTGLGGHVHVADRAFISGGVMIHQWTHVGTLAMVGGNSKITQDCLPYMITDGVPGVVRGLNVVGLKRAGFDMQTVRELKGAYRTLFDEHRPLETILGALDSSESAAVRHLAEFIRASKRKFHRTE